jgi:hypothetical protein
MALIVTPAREKSQAGEGFNCAAWRLDQAWDFSNSCMKSTRAWQPAIGMAL